MYQPCCIAKGFFWRRTLTFVPFASCGYKFQFWAYYTDCLRRNSQCCCPQSLIVVWGNDCYDHSHYTFCNFIKNGCATESRCYLPAIKLQKAYSVDRSLANNFPAASKF